MEPSEEEGGKEIIQSCHKELLALLENENTLEINLKSATESLQKYLYTLFLHLLKQRNLRLGTGSSSPVSYGVVHTRSFQDTKRVLNDNLSYLTENTCDWPKLKIHLRQWGLLSGSDVQKLDKIPDDESRYYDLYTIVAKQPDWPKKLVKCLNDSNNEHIAEVISEGLSILEKNKLKQKETYLDSKEELMTKKEDNLSQVEQIEKFIKTSRSNRNSVADEISLAETKEAELQAQIEILNAKVREANYAEAKARIELKTIIGTENKVTFIEELENLRKHNISLQSQRDGLQDELSKLMKLLQDKNNELEMLKLETEMLEQELKNLLMAKLELQKEIDQLNFNYNAEKSHNQETMNLLVKIKFENIQEVLKLRKQIEELEDERCKLLMNRSSNSESELEFRRPEEDKLCTMISKLEESAQEMSQEAMINCTVDPEDEIWELYCSRLIAERKLEVNELESRINNTKTYLEIHQDLIKIHRSSCRDYGMVKMGSSGGLKVEIFLEQQLEKCKAEKIQKDYFGYYPEFYERIRSRYVEDEAFKKEIRIIPAEVKNTLYYQHITRSSFKRTYDKEYLQYLKQGKHEKRLDQLYEAFGLIEPQNFENHPCECPRTDSLPCVLHANLFRCLTLVRLSGDTVLSRKKREPNYLVFGNSDEETENHVEEESRSSEYETEDESEELSSSSD